MGVFDSLFRDQPRSQEHDETRVICPGEEAEDQAREAFDKTASHALDRFTPDGNGGWIGKASFGYSRGYDNLTVEEGAYTTCGGEIDFHGKRESWKGAEITLGLKQALERGDKTYALGGLKPINASAAQSLLDWLTEQRTPFGAVNLSDLSEVQKDILCALDSGVCTYADLCSLVQIDEAEARKEIDKLNGMALAGSRKEGTRDRYQPLFIAMRGSFLLRKGSVPTGKDGGNV
jgi:hypothetical protein